MIRKGMLGASMLLVIIFAASVGFTAYHHEGEKDAAKFLTVYPDKAGSKLDHCSLCHTGGQYEMKPGEFVTLGSCLWCHTVYGYDGSGNILETLNGYGKDFHDHGRNVKAIRDIDKLDSDGDGFTNAAEIAAVRYPGDAKDDPEKIPAPYRVFTKAQLESMPQHTQFLLMNTNRSGDSYAEYTGVRMDYLLKKVGLSSAATGITVFSPDGWSNYHPLDPSDDPGLYHVRGVYPEAVYQYDSQADVALNPLSGWCDYSAPSCKGRLHLDPIVVENGLRMILAYKREGAYLIPGVLNEENKLDGEGPFRVVPPQKVPSPPDQSSKSSDQNVIWPYNEGWDHNAGYSSRTATMIRVEPLPPKTTDIDTLEVGWEFVDEEKIVIYGAVDALPVIKKKLAELISVLDSIPITGFRKRSYKGELKQQIEEATGKVVQGAYKVANNRLRTKVLKKSDGCIRGDAPDGDDWIRNPRGQNQVYWRTIEIMRLIQLKMS